MATQLDDTTKPRLPMSRQRVLGAAIALADAGGVEALSMLRLAHELGVVPMALYKHVANKDELLDGMVDVVVGEIDPPGGADWKTAIRQRVLSARRALLRHRWASRVIESRTSPTPAVLGYMDSMIGLFRAGGFSIDLTHTPCTPWAAACSASSAISTSPAAQRTCSARSRCSANAGATSGW